MGLQGISLPEWINNATDPSNIKCSDRNSLLLFNALRGVSSYKGLSAPWQFYEGHNFLPSLYLWLPFPPLIYHQTIILLVMMPETDYHHNLPEIRLDRRKCTKLRRR